MDEDRYIPAEENHRAALTALHNGAAGPRRGRGAAHDTRTRQWFLPFLAAGLAWLLGLLMDLAIPLITLVMNYLVVLALWMWAKAAGLRPPSFASAARKIPGPATDATPEPPGSDIAYVLLGGLTPLLYLTALWWNNRRISG